jgi:hypothetical protein
MNYMPDQRRLIGILDKNDRRRPANIRTRNWQGRCLDARIVELVSLS